MPHLVIHQKKLTPALVQTLIGLCPFGAISEQNGQLVIGSGCRLCRQCVKAGEGAVELCGDAPAAAVDKSLWRGIAVFAELRGSEVHPVVPELIGKALELRESCPQPVWAVLVGHGCHDAARELAHYGADAVYVYDDPLLDGFDPQRYTACLSDFIVRQHPAAVMVGATMLGRSLAPRTAARFRTGLTADCTRLEMRENSDLVQIRPAFGGNIMARILTPHARPQFCTVRYRVFDRAARRSTPAGPVISLPLPAQRRDIALPLPQYPIRLLHQAFHIAPSPPVRMHAHIAHQADLQGIPTVMAGDKQNRDRRHDPPLLLQGQMQDIMSRLRLVGLRQQLHKIRSLSIHAEYIIDKINQIRIIVPRKYLIFHHPRLLLSALILH